MSEEGQRQFFNPIPPYESNVAGIGVTYLTATTSAAKLDISAAPRLYGCLLELIASGDKIWFSTSVDGATDIDKTATGGTTLAAGTDPKNAIPIGNGVALTVKLTKGLHKFIHWQADTANSVLIIRAASQPNLSDIVDGT